MLLSANKKIGGCGFSAINLSRRLLFSFVTFGATMREPFRMEHSREREREQQRRDDCPYSTSAKGESERDVGKSAFTRERERRVGDSYALAPLCFLNGGRRILLCVFFGGRKVRGEFPPLHCSSRVEIGCHCALSFVRFCLLLCECLCARERFFIKVCARSPEMSTVEATRGFSHLIVFLASLYF